MEIIERMGLGIFVQIIMEMSFNLILLIIVLVMLIGINEDKKHSFMRKVSVPYTKTILLFYLLVLGYNVAHVVISCYEGAVTRKAVVLMQIFMFFYFWFGESLTLFFLEVLWKKVLKKMKNRFLTAVFRALRVLQFLIFMLLITNPFTDFLYYMDEQNGYHRADGYWIWFGNSILTFVFIGGVCVLYWKKIDLFFRKTINICVVIPLLAFILNVFEQRVNMNNIAVILAALHIYVVYEEYKTRYAVEICREMERMQIKLMLSQIQPHFLYNSLTSIIYYADKDPGKTKTALVDFSRYLRKNLEAISAEGPVRFEDELEHTKKYLALEKLRFEEKLKIVYEIEDRDFSLPVLTLQPLVENAVKHGIRKNRDGTGQVTIRTFRKAEKHVIEVIDDGVGFDVESLSQSDDTHIGVMNVKKRLGMECGGSLEVESKPGEGTKCRIILSDEWME